MKEELKQRYYEEQVPTLLKQMTRIADALERHVELLEERQTVVMQHLDVEKTETDGQQEDRRKKLETQLQKLAELDQMARELRGKLEKKRAADAAAAASSSVEKTDSDAGSGGADEVVREPSDQDEN